MTRLSIGFHGGPCNGIRTTTTEFAKPPDFIRCSDRAYIYNPTRSGETLWYQVEPLQEQPDLAYLQGRRDVFKAWHRLMTTLDKSQKAHHRRLHAASQRMRRAVR